jgi:hypothetical protein
MNPSGMKELRCASRLAYGLLMSPALVWISCSASACALDLQQPRRKMQEGDPRWGPAWYQALVVH